MVSTNNDRQYKYTGLSLSTMRREYLWSEKSCIVYFHLHPFMGHGNLDITTSVFPENRRTLKGWLTKKELISRWLPIVQKLNGPSVKRAIPIEHNYNYYAPDARYARKHISLVKYQKRIQDEKQKRFSIVKGGFNTRMDIVAAKTKNLYW